MCRFAYLMQELVAFFKGGSCKQQAALLLVVVDVCLYRGDVAWNNLCVDSDGQQLDYARQGKHKPFRAPPVAAPCVICILHLTQILYTTDITCLTHIHYPHPPIHS